MHRKTAAALAFAAVGSAHADMVWIGSENHRAASATFSIVDTDLEITLTNTSSADAMVPVDILSAVYFNISGAPVTLIPISAILAAGSVVHFGVADPGGIVGGEWAFRAGPHSGYTSGIGSSSSGPFSAEGRFPGSNLQGPEDPGGIEYGLTSAGDNPSTGNPHVSGTHALIQNSVVFRLGGLPAGFDLGRIDAVEFHYGSSHSGPSFAAVPSPGPLAAFILAGVAARRRRVA